jgi:DNA-binding winged helix-turn-helix (wHTH) protein
MNSKKIIVFDYDTLFEILDEIKEKLNFDVTKIDTKNINQVKDDSNGDFLLVSRLPVSNFKNNLVIKDEPFKIGKLIEQINLKFLKNKFVAQSDIEVGFYKLNLNSREISKKNISISLTEREINLILFLKNAEKPVNIDQLQRKVWEYGTDLETHTVETHIYRLRKKIKEKFEDENFIVSLKDGYTINEKKK